MLSIDGWGGDTSVVHLTPWPCGPQTIAFYENVHGNNEQMSNGTTPCVGREDSPCVAMGGARARAYSNIRVMSLLLLRYLIFLSCGGLVAKYRVWADLCKRRRRTDILAPLDTSFHE
ncbi:hypothetical protein J6590_029463 [Homalodisca vitripennis]|nr:hypothetical protein J6590_029463 [Homalodisca vitripennis]